MINREDIATVVAVDKAGISSKRVLIETKRAAGNTGGPVRFVSGITMEIVGKKSY